MWAQMLSSVLQQPVVGPLAQFLNWGTACLQVGVLLQEFVGVMQSTTPGSELSMRTAASELNLSCQDL